MAVGNDVEVQDAVDVRDIGKLRRLSAVDTREAYTSPPERTGNFCTNWFRWYASWAIPGLGMFSEAYVIFSLGLTKPLQEAVFPGCFKTHTECPKTLTHVQSYIQIVGIIAGMLVFGVLGDIIGRRWGSRMVASIMLTGTIALTLIPLISNPLTYLQVYIAAATFYGFGVGGEYPMASASAAERSQADESLRHKRGQQVVLTFSGQGMGSLVNGCVILIFMAMLGQTGPKLEARGSRDVVILQFAVAAFVTVFMTGWRWLRLKESKVWETEREDFEELAESEFSKLQPTSGLDPTTPAPDGHARDSLTTPAAAGANRHSVTSSAPGAGAHAHHSHAATATVLRGNALRHFWPRLVATCCGWLANDFAFYGAKLFQNTFIALLYPDATPFERMQWSVLNCAVSLMGYYAAAVVVDKPWYGRLRMQCYGFLAMFVLFTICGAAFPVLLASKTGLQAFQALYFLSSFFNQFGPNCTTWLVAAEVYPTDVRTTFQGASAAAGKAGAIAADVLFGLLSQRASFVMSAAFGLVGAAVTYAFLPDTTGLCLDELDRMAKYMVAGEWEHYHGEAVNPKHLSWFERRVLKWDRHYNPEIDARHAFHQRMGSMRWVAKHGGSVLSADDTQAQRDLKALELELARSL